MVVAGILIEDQSIPICISHATRLNQSQRLIALEKFARGRREGGEGARSVVWPIADAHSHPEESCPHWSGFVLQCHRQCLGDDNRLSGLMSSGRASVMVAAGVRRIV